MVGHTHEDIDQVFSRVAVHLRNIHRVTLPQLQEGIAKSTSQGIRVHHLDGLQDYRSQLLKSKGALEGVSGPHHFMITEESGHILLRYKDWPDTPVSTVDLSQHVPEDFVHSDAKTSPKLAGEISKFDLKKWKDCGRLSEEEEEWWSDNISEFNKAKPASVPLVTRLPTCQERPQLPTPTSQLDAIEEMDRRQSKASKLKLKKKK